MAMRKNSRTDSKRKRTRRLGKSLENLENRRLMAFDWMGQIGAIPEIEFNGDGSDVVIVGTSFHDTATVEVFQNGTPNPIDDAVRIKVSNNIGGSDSLTLQRLDPQGNDRIRQIVFKGYGGNDSFNNDSSLPSKAYGGNGNDRLTGGSDVDIFFGGNGIDILQGNRGNDILFGQRGTDLLYGSAGDDSLRGGADADFLFGQGGEDHLWGGTGDDYLSGGSQNDILYGEAGDDKLHGGFHKDLLDGGRGDDHLEGGYGDDTLIGDKGRDRLYGDHGNDLMHGGSGNDILYGGDGNDFMIGGTGSDSLFGEGNDDFLIAGQSSISDYLSGETLHADMIDRDLEDNANDGMYGGEGNDHFVVSDYGFFDPNVDSVRDLEDDEQVDFIEDNWGYDLGIGAAFIPAYGHLSE